MGFFPLYGQNSVQFTQYMYNMISVNPAYAGSREYLIVNAMNRNQWLGINGAPITQTFSAHTLLPSSNLGVGISLINDQLGYESIFQASIDLSYTLILDKSETYRFAFGIKAGARKYNIDDELLNSNQNIPDPYLEGLNFKLKPKMGVGAYFRGESFYLGIGTPNIMGYSKRTGSDYVSVKSASYYFNGGYLFDLNKHLQVKPSFLFKYTNGAPISVDVNVNAYINQKLSMGLFHRLNDSFGALSSFKANEEFSIGYSYDFTISELNRYTSGSHEILLSYHFKNFPKTRKISCKDLYN